MARIVIAHAVHDVDRWLKGKDERAAALPGATDFTDRTGTAVRPGSTAGPIAACPSDMSYFRRRRIKCQESLSPTPSTMLTVG